MKLKVDQQADALYLTLSEDPASRTGCCSSPCPWLAEALQVMACTNIDRPIIPETPR